MTAMTRRERLRHELTAEIKRVALQQLTLHGPDAVTFRGIARELSVSPAALYGYFSSLDDLYSALITDGFNLLAQFLEDAIATQPDGDYGNRMLAAMLAYRVWAIERPELFRLLYFSPIPGYVAPEDGPTLNAALRVSAAFLVVLVAGWETAGVDDLTPGPPVDNQKFAERFGLHITPGQLRTAVGCWGQFHGLTCLEVAGHIGLEWTDPEALYDASIRALLRRTGFAELSTSLTAATFARS